MDEIKPLSPPETSSIHNHILKILQEQIDNVSQGFKLLSQESPQVTSTASGAIVAQHLYILKTIGLLANAKQELQKLKERYEKERS